MDSRIRQGICRVPLPVMEQTQHPFPFGLPPKSSGTVQGIRLSRPETTVQQGGMGPAEMDQWCIWVFALITRRPFAVWNRRTICMGILPGCLWTRFAKPYGCAAAKRYCLAVTPQSTALKAMPFIRTCCGFTGKRRTGIGKMCFTGMLRPCLACKPSGDLGRQRKARKSEWIHPFLPAFFQKDG